MSMCSQRPAQLKGFLYTRRSATREIGELLESLGHNPIEAMVQMATDPEASLELRGRMNAELAHYVYPKRKAVEVAGDQEAPLVPSRVVVQICSDPAGASRVSRWMTSPPRNSLPKCYQLSQVENLPLTSC